MSRPPRVGLTQRVTVVEEYGERRDCLDQTWTSLLEDWGYQPVPLPNTVADVSAYLASLELDGIVLTSGNDLAQLEDPAVPAPERDEFETAAIDWARDRSVPVLGVCRGLELLNYHFGGSLSPIDDHVATTHEVRFTDDAERPTGPPFPDRLMVNSYHDYGITPPDLAPQLNALGTAPDGSIECLAHPDEPLLGIMWHPERETPSGAIDQQVFAYLFRDDRR